MKSVRKTKFGCLVVFGLCLYLYACLPRAASKTQIAVYSRASYQPLGLHESQWDSLVFTIFVDENYKLSPIDTSTSRRKLLEDGLELDYNSDLQALNRACSLLAVDELLVVQIQDETKDTSTIRFSRFVRSLQHVKKDSLQEKSLGELTYEIPQVIRRMFAGFPQFGIAKPWHKFAIIAAAGAVTLGSWARAVIGGDNDATKKTLPSPDEPVKRQ